MNSIEWEARNFVNNVSRAFNNATNNVKYTTDRYVNQLTNSYSNNYTPYNSYNQPYLNNSTDNNARGFMYIIIGILLFIFLIK